MIENEEDLIESLNLPEVVHYYYWREDQRAILEEKEDLLDKEKTSCSRWHHFFLKGGSGEPTPLTAFCSDPSLHTTQIHFRLSNRPLANEEQKTTTSLFQQIIQIGMFLTLEGSRGKVESQKSGNKSLEESSYNEEIKNAMDRAPYAPNHEIVIPSNGLFQPPGTAPVKIQNVTSKSHTAKPCEQNQRITKMPPQRVEGRNPKLNILRPDAAHLMNHAKNLYPSLEHIDITPFDPTKGVSNLKPVATEVQEAQHIKAFAPSDKWMDVVGFTQQFDFLKKEIAELKEAEKLKLEQREKEARQQKIAEKIQYHQHCRACCLINNDTRGKYLK